MIDHVRNDINVTPLVDVMLVLLIIFMLMTMLMGRGEDVTIPRAKNISTEPDQLQPIVSIDEKGTLYVEKRRVGEIDKRNLEVMGELVKAVWVKKPRGNGRVYIKADQNIPYSTVYPVLDYINKNLNLDTIDLAVAETSKGLAMGMNVGCGSPNTVKNDINVTPLIDVLLVLLDHLPRDHPDHDEDGDPAGPPQDQRHRGAGSGRQPAHDPRQGGHVDVVQRRHHGHGRAGRRPPTSRRCCARSSRRCTSATRRSCSSTSRTRSRGRWSSRPWTSIRSLASDANHDEIKVALKMKEDVPKP